MEHGFVTIVTNIFTNRLKKIGILRDVGNLPLPTSNSSNFWIGNFAKFTEKGLCVSTESSDLLAKSSHRNDRLKSQADFPGAGNFYRCRLQILGNLFRAT